MTSKSRSFSIVMGSSGAYYRTYGIGEYCWRSPVSDITLCAGIIAEILDWFDYIETTNVQTVMGNCQRSTESVDRYRLFLEYLG